MVDLEGMGGQVIPLCPLGIRLAPQLSFFSVSFLLYNSSYLKLKAKLYIPALWHGAFSAGLPIPWKKC